MKTSEILIAAKALIENPENWVRGDYARPAKDSSDSIYGNDPKATCFCSLGALQRINNDEDHCTTGHEYLHHVAMTGYDKSIVDVNDEHDHQEVMALWDKAIEKAKQDEDRNDN